MTEDQREYFERYNEQKIHHFLNNHVAEFTASKIAKATNISWKDVNYALKSLHIQRLITKRKVKKLNTSSSLWMIKKGV